jgi:hypothetical protein
MEFSIGLTLPANELAYTAGDWLDITNDFDQWRGIGTGVVGYYTFSSVISGCHIQINTTNLVPLKNLENRLQKEVSSPR